MTRSSLPPPRALNGQVIKGRYLIHDQVARGATAAIYQADDLTNNTRVAIKVLVNRGETYHQRMLQEWRTISSLDHPCLARIHDVGETSDGAPFLVLDLLQGETLGEALRRVGAMPPAQALPLLRRAARALGVAHRAGVVHRDVKPDNLFLLGPIGAPTDVRVVDFGLAKGTSRLTAPGITVGTAEYMAPEQTLTDPVDGRTDIYAFGVVLFRCFAGSLPFSDHNKLTLMARQLLVEPPAFTSRHCDADTAARLGRVIACAMRKRPEHRYATMDALAADLSLLMQGQPPQGCHEPAAEDTYVPRSDFGQGVVASFYQLLGWSAPAWADEVAEEEL